MELKEVFEPIITFLKNFQKKQNDTLSKDKAKERLQLVLMQDRASVSPDFFEMMKKEIIEVIKKYIEIDEELLEVQLTRGFENDDGSGPALYANIPIKNIKPVAKKAQNSEEKKPIEELTEDEAQEVKENIISEIKEVTEAKTSNKKEEIVKEIKQEEQKAVDVIEKTESEEEEVEELIDEVSEDVDEVIDEEVSKSKIVAEGIKAKLNNAKDAAQIAFSKVKSGAKDGIEKIKSKVKAKNQ